MRGREGKSSQVRGNTMEANATTFETNQKLKCVAMRLRLAAIHRHINFNALYLLYRPKPGTAAEIKRGGGLTFTWHAFTENLIHELRALVGMVSRSRAGHAINLTVVLGIFFELEL